MLLEVVLVALAAMPANLIVWLYYRARWWTTDLGRGMAVTAASVAVMLDLALVARAIPETREVVRALITPLYLSLTYGLWLKYRAFRALERERRARIARIVRVMPLDPAHPKEHP